MNVLGVIPARMGATRFPGKPMARVLGLTMVEHVYRRAMLAKGLTDLYVATCDQEIYDAVVRFGGRPLMTSDRHVRACDRVAEAAGQVGGDADFVVNVQGDEILLRPEAIDLLCQAMADDPTADSYNLVAEITTEEGFLDPNQPKVVCDVKGYVMYMSREPIPTMRHLGLNIPKYRQMGLMGFTRAFMKIYGELPPTPLEQAEAIDMDRVIEHGYRIKAVVSSYDSPMVDVPADLEIVERLMRDDALAKEYLRS